MPELSFFFLFCCENYLLDCICIVIGIFFEWKFDNSSDNIIIATVVI